ncbi:glycosyltransferase [Ornithinimicrobium panacihumi]|uniref:glycosyltransferase n=1 Tax=Ornithinimicrobium panacihumi TaxID=2008449 RepID=UPI003F8A5912
MTARVVVSLGTYHLPFDRLVDWTDSWQRPQGVEVLVQHGVSRSAQDADNVVMLPHPVLLQTYSAADVLVLQGGAGGVMDALAVGHVPIVVPRLPELNEVVDHHQVHFGRLLARDGLVHLAETEAMLHELLDQALGGRVEVRRTVSYRSPGAAVAIRHLDGLATTAGESAEPVSRGAEPAAARAGIAGSGMERALRRGLWVGRRLVPSARKGSAPQLDVAAPRPRQETPAG